MRDFNEGIQVTEQISKFINGSPAMGDAKAASFCAVRARSGRRFQVCNLYSVSPVAGAPVQLELIDWVDVQASGARITMDKSPQKEGARRRRRLLALAQNRRAIWLILGASAIVLGVAFGLGYFVSF